MFYSSLARAINEIEQISRQIRFMESVRAGVVSAHGRLNQLEQPTCALSATDITLLDSSYSRRADHFLAYGAGYAVLESFINDLVRSLLRFYERSGRYDQLSHNTKTALRTGTARVLDRINWRRFSHLSELSIVKNYYDALSGGELSFADDVIISSDANYRPDELRDLFRKCGMPELWERVKNDPDLKNFLSYTILEDNSLDSALNLVVSRRNEVSHGVVEGIDSTELLLEILKFLINMFSAIFKSILVEYSTILLDRDRLKIIGSIKERFRRTIGVVSFEPGEIICVGDCIAILRDGIFQLFEVQEMKLDDVNIQSCRGSLFLDVGVNFGNEIPKQGEVFKLLHPTDGDLLAQR